MSAKKKTVTATVKIFTTESVAVTKTVALTAKVTVNYSDISFVALGLKIPLLKLPRAPSI